VRREGSYDNEPEEDGEGEGAVVDEEAEDLAEDCFEGVRGGLLMGAIYGVDGTVCERLRQRGTVARARSR
jgi:hypothetical protein